MKNLSLIVFLFISFYSTAQTSRIEGAYIPIEIGTEFNGWHYFSASDSSGTELWKTQGDSAYFVKDFHLGFTYQFNAWVPKSSAPGDFTVYNGSLYFTIVNNGTNFRQIVKMNSNEMFSYILPSTNNSIIGDLKVFNNKLYYFEFGSNGASLISYDGSVQTPVLNLPNISQSFEATFFEFQSKLVFGYSECDTCNGNLYFYDGTTIIQGPEYFNNDFTIIPNGYYFSGSDFYKSKFEIYQNDLFYIWRDSASLEIRHFDGVNTFTMPFNGEVKDELKAFNGKLYFNGDDGTTGFELWSFNGSVSQLVNNIHSGYGIPTPTGPTGFELYNGLMYLTQADTLWNYELWVNDGISVSLVQELSSGYHWGVVRFPGIVNTGTNLYFVGNNDASWDDALYRLDDCPSDTILVYNISECNSYTLPTGLTVNSSGTYNDTVYGICGLDTVNTIHIIDLSIDSVNINTTVNGTSITAVEPNASYQWVVCNGFLAIPGGNSQNYAPQVNGDFAVIITNNQTVVRIHQHVSVFRI